MECPTSHPDVVFKHGVVRSQRTAVRDSERTAELLFASRPHDVGQEVTAFDHRRRPPDELHSTGMRLGKVSEQHRIAQQHLGPIYENRTRITGHIALEARGTHLDRKPNNSDGSRVASILSGVPCARGHVSDERRPRHLHVREDRCNGAAVQQALVRLHVQVPHQRDL
eukprot:1164372-Rhodomonas_salina.1